MRVHNVIIVTSGRTNSGFVRELENILALVRDLKKTPILVLGPDGDDLLRACDNAENCEMVFDPNYQGNLFSGIKAGMALVKGASFVLPLGEPYLAKADWLSFESALMKNHEKHVLEPVTQANGQTISYPKIVTSQGISSLKELAAQEDWLKQPHVSIEPIPLEDETRQASTSP